MDLAQRHFKVHRSIFSRYSRKKICKSGLYEIWYSMLNDTKSGEGYWIRYALLIPQQVTADDFQGNAILWFGYSNLTYPEKNFLIKKFYPISEAVETSEDHIIKIGTSELALTALKGEFSTTNNQLVSWDLQLSDCIEPYISTPAIFKTIGLTNTLNFGTHPNVQFDGKITINDRTIEIAKCRGLQYHTYGDAYTIPWEWLNAHNFDHYESAFLDFGYKVDKGILEYFNGNQRISFWNNGIISKLKVTKKINREHSPTALTFSIEYKGVTITGKVSVPQERLLGVEYLGPRGNRFYCYNTSLADLELTVITKSEKITHRIEGAVSFETVYQKPVDGIPYLPWKDEFIDN